MIDYTETIGMFLKTLKASLVATTALVMAATSAQAADEVEVSTGGPQGVKRGP